MEKLQIIVLASAVAYLSTVYGQLNGVRENLRPCYNISAMPGILIADNRPPESLNVFLEILRRLEDANPTKSAAELSVLLIQRLRQDGIIFTGGNTDPLYAIAFSSIGYEAIKGTLIGQRFLQNLTTELFYGDLDPMEICTFHYMISSSINTTMRGDEKTTCMRAARYTSRIRRSDDNIELADFAPRSWMGSIINDTSQCPLEMGVFHTNYGTIKGGQVLNGIATGAYQQDVNGCDNRYAATISGELAEAALVQTKNIVKVGVSGGWNSTISPKYYFLQQNNNLDVTNAEIRGSLDGLYMSLKMKDWKSSDIKISQILDMYYSPYQRGVFDSSFRACNRNILYSEMVATEKIREQTIAFMSPLDDAGTFPNTISLSSHSQFGNGAVDSFISAMPSLKDLACAPTDQVIERVSSDLHIFLDPSWSYTTVQPLLSYILDNIDVNKFGSRYTLYSGSDVVNVTSYGTRYLLEFYKKYNSSSHQNLRSDFDYSKVFQTIESIAKSKLNNNTYAGGESTVALLLPRTMPNESQKTFLNQRKEIFRQFLPDLTILVVGSGTQGDYNSVLANPSKDFIPLSESTNENDIKTLGETVVTRIKAIPRSIVNPSCGSELVGTTNTFTLTDYVEPKGVNKYRISPNYFYAGQGTRNLKITELSYGSITVCISSNQPVNQTNDCETAKSSVLTRDLSTFCRGKLSDCTPIYISVTGNTTLNKCKGPDVLCRFPDNIKYTISLENVGCASGTIRLVANIILVFTLYVALRF
ncbi:unnamed protein product [Phaedon cochleariae]|uniref:Uncharacterized protein n=1 Tax=Phaedon cochleariae TaxID=80249 RepID=A0A9P0DKI3_PHACE|nr:unnamed protein product [Phaedon cochleariae]